MFNSTLGYTLLQGQTIKIHLSRMFYLFSIKAAKHKMGILGAILEATGLKGRQLSVNMRNDVLLFSRVSPGNGQVVDPVNKRLRPGPSTDTNIKHQTVTDKLSLTQL